MESQKVKIIPLTRESGFSLVELIVVIIILGLVMGIAYGVILLNARTFGYLSDTIVSRWDMRKAMEVVRNDVQELNALSIYSSLQSGNRLYFKTIDGHKILYIYANKKVMRATTGGGWHGGGHGGHHGWGKHYYGGWNVLLDNVLKPPFLFLDRDMHTTTDINKLVYIKVQFEVQNKGQNTITLKDVFYLRNTAPLTP